MERARSRPAVLAAVTQDIKVKQRSVSVTDRDQLVKCIAPRHAQLALGQQHRGHRLVLPFRRFFFAFHYSTVPPSFERETIS